MRRNDARKLDHKTLEELRMRVVKRVREGESPEVLAISAITSRGHMRFMLVEKGGVDADVFIEFLKRLAIGAKRAIFLIVDRGPAHIAKKTKAFVESLNDAPRLFYLPPYSPDRNPDDLVGKHLKADTVGRMTVTSKDDFKSKVRSSMRQLQNNPAKIRSFHQKPSLRYAA
ncbi:MAG: transposase [Methylocystis sp.]